MKHLLTLIALLPLFAAAQIINFKKVDNQLHLGAGMAAANIGLSINDKSHPAFIAIGSATLVGVFKEVFDSMHSNNKFCAEDLAWSITGGVIGYGLNKIGAPKSLTIGVGLGFVGVRFTELKMRK